MSIGDNGEENFDGEELARELNLRKLPGVYFLPKYYVARTGHWIDEMPGAARAVKLCNGVLIVITDRNAYRPVSTQLHIIDVLIKYYPELDLESNKTHGRVRMQTDEIVDAAQNGESLLPYIKKWEKSANEFMKQREKYLLY